MYDNISLAETLMHIGIILSHGSGVGFLSGLTGDGGGSLITPLVTGFAEPPAFAVGIEANQVVA